MSNIVLCISQLQSTCCRAGRGHALDPRHHPLKVVGLGRVGPQGSEGEAAVAADDGGDAVVGRRA